MPAHHRDHGLLSNRRQFLAAGGAGALALGGLGFAAAPHVAHAFQLDSTPPAPPVPVAPSTDPIADLAATLTYDVDAIVAFVRARIHYEAYAGVLRGARGTLLARAGNAADQAVLLGALLDAAQANWRYATGALDAAAAETLAANLSLTGPEARRAYDEASEAAILQATGLDALPSTPASTNPEVTELLDRFTKDAAVAVDRATATAATSGTAIANALAGAGIDLPPLPDATLPATEIERHAWIQVADGATWIDHDPTLPEGAEPLPAIETFTEVPDDWYHQLRVVISADEFVGGAVYRREVVSLATTSQRVVDVPIALSMASGDELASLGSAITQIASGQKLIFPTIYADGLTVEPSSPLILATDVASASDPFGEASNGGLAEGETVAVWLAVEITSPGEAMRTIERPLLDRLTPEDRASDTFVPENIAPVKVVPVEGADDTPVQFDAITIVHTDVARTPPLGALARFGSDDLFGALGILGPSLAGFRDALGLQEEAATGTWSYPSAPNITFFHVAATPSATGEEAGPVTLQADLVYRARTSLPLADAALDLEIHPLVRSGVLDAIAEQMLLAPETRGETEDTTTYATGPTVGAVFAAAAEGNIEIRVIATTADLDAVDADAQSRSLIAAALEVGNVVVAPVQPVTVGGEPVLGWWIVDPATGRTSDQLQDGMASASTSGIGMAPVLFGPKGEYSLLTRAIMWIVANSRALACFGAAVAYGLIASTVILGVDPGNAGAVATGAVLGGGAAGAAGGLCLGP